MPPLGVPPADGPLDVETLGAYEAVQLFVARAQSADPEFDITTENAAAIAGITSALAGLPLAIELAAARVRSLTPDELLAKLPQRLRILTGGPADSADRHRTMRDAIAWSYELLTPDEQSLLRSLGVFRGGFTLDAVAQVASLTDSEVLDGIDSLVSQSLLVRSTGTRSARFSMFEMICEFALDQMAATERQKLPLIAMPAISHSSPSRSSRTSTVRTLRPRLSVSVRRTTTSVLPCNVRSWPRTPTWASA